MFAGEKNFDELSETKPFRNRISKARFPANGIDQMGKCAIVPTKIRIRTQVSVLANPIRRHSVTQAMREVQNKTETDVHARHNKTVYFSFYSVVFQVVYRDSPWTQYTGSNASRQSQLFPEQFAVLGVTVNGGQSMLVH